MAEAKEKAPADKTAGREIEATADILATFEVGLEVALQKDISTGQNWAAMAGWLAGKAVILDGPRALVKQGILFGGNAVRARYLHLGRLYGFAANVLQVWREPMLVVLDWPERVEMMPLGSERRVSTRMSTNLTLMHAGGRTSSFAAQIDDLSRSGCRVRVERDRQTDRRFEPGSQIEITLELPGWDKPVAMKAEVRNVLTREGFLSLGSKFSEKEQAREREAIAVLVESQL